MIYPSDVSPDGTVLLYTRGTGLSADLWYLRLNEDRTPHPFVQTPSHERDGQFSPDGKWLAFVRRVRNQSTLFLKDLSTGREMPAWDGLDRDMQETWAVHGVYPQYAWFPDGKSFVIWGEGKLWRVDAASGRGQEIPFTAHVEQNVNDAVRFPQKIYTPEFPVKMLRDVATSPIHGGIPIMISCFNRRAAPGY